MVVCNKGVVCVELRVQSEQQGGVVYEVVDFGVFYTCTCPQCVGRGDNCKHQGAVRYYAHGVGGGEQGRPANIQPRAKIQREGYYAAYREGEVPVKKPGKKSKRQNASQAGSGQRLNQAEAPAPPAIGAFLL
jgi:hypothetical protein